MRKSRLSAHKQAKLLENLAPDMTSSTAAELVDVKKTAVAYYFHLLHELVNKPERKEVPSGRGD